MPSPATQIQTLSGSRIDPAHGCQQRCAAPESTIDEEEISLKPPLFAISLICLAMVSASALGQTVFACQAEASTGFAYDKGRWERSNFLADSRFFLRLTSDGRLDTRSVSGALSDGKTQYAYLYRCENFEDIREPERHSCSSMFSEVLTFNSLTGTGAYAKIGGGSSAGVSYRDTISVTRFICQRM